MNVSTRYRPSSSSSNATRANAWVVKLGGSLLGTDELGHWLGVICQGHSDRRRLVVVPGGGPFADAVREVQRRTRCSERAAHLAALKAMEQTALLLCDYGLPLFAATDINAIHASWRRRQIPVWLPFAQLGAADDIAHSWDVTSDSLAAWLAAALEADALVLVKSIGVTEHAPTAPRLRDNGVVDGAFPEFVRGRPFGVWLCQATRHNEFRDALQRGRPPGIRVRTASGSAAGRPAGLRT